VPFNAPRSTRQRRRRRRRHRIPFINPFPLRARANATKRSRYLAMTPLEACAGKTQPGQQGHAEAAKQGDRVRTREGGSFFFFFTFFLFLFFFFFFFIDH
jgi:hypothetical protein